MVHWPYEAMKKGSIVMCRELRIEYRFAGEAPEWPTTSWRMAREDERKTHTTVNRVVKACCALHSLI